MVGFVWQEEWGRRAGCVQSLPTHHEGANRGTYCGMTAPTRCFFSCFVWPARTQCWSVPLPVAPSCQSVWLSQGGGHPVVLAFYIPVTCTVCAGTGFGGLVSCPLSGVPFVTSPPFFSPTPPSQSPHCLSSPMCGAASVVFPLGTTLAVSTFHKLTPVVFVLVLVGGACCRGVLIMHGVTWVVGWG